MREGEAPAEPSPSANLWLGWSLALLPEVIVRWALGLRLSLRVEDFDGGGTAPYALTGIAVVEPGGGAGDAVKLARLGGGAGTIAFDHEAVSGDRLTQISLSFDFSMTDDATNTASDGYFDNIDLTEVAPEPATLSLLGLGALALLRRRRR